MRALQFPHILADLLLDAVGNVRVLLQIGLHAVAALSDALIAH